MTINTTSQQVGGMFLPLKMLESLVNKGFPQYLQGFLKSGAEGNRSPVKTLYLQGKTGLV